MSRGPGLCGICRREIPMRRDGRLRAHLAAGSRPGRRETCDGSGGWSARLELLDGGEPAAREAVTLTRAAAFNAREEWAKVDALYFELHDMTELGAASPAAIESVRQALARALDGAEALAPWWACGRYADSEDAAL